MLLCPLLFSAPAEPVLSQNKEYTMSTIHFPLGDDMHLHVRSGAKLRSVVKHTAAQFGRAIIMPNLAPKHITTVAEVLNYRQDILNAVPMTVSFLPLMTVSLSSDMTPADLRDAMSCEHVYGVKLYAGHTTNSEGVTDVQALAWAFEILEKAGKPLLMHGEAGVTVDVFNRERSFYENEMLWISGNFPNLKIVCEHITSRAALDYVFSEPLHIVATITPQHLLSNRNDMLGKGGIRPDLYCMPILKTEEDRVALLEAATSGNPKFFLGTDSAPHQTFGLPKQSKYSACGCAGCFTATHALELYAEAFDSVGELEKLPSFASKFGREFYGLPPNAGRTTIEKVVPWELPESFPFGDEEVAPYRQHVPLEWKATRVP